MEHIIEKLLDLELKANDLKNELINKTSDNASDLDIIETHLKKVREDQMKQLC